jgi:hypothetical protein
MPKWMRQLLYTNTLYRILFLTKKHFYCKTRAPIITRQSRVFLAPRATLNNSQIWHQNASKMDETASSKTILCKYRILTKVKKNAVFYRRTSAVVCQSRVFLAPRMPRCQNRESDCQHYFDHFIRLIFSGRSREKIIIFPWVVYSLKKKLYYWMMWQKIEYLFGMFRAITTQTIAQYSVLASSSFPARAKNYRLRSAVIPDNNETPSSQFWDSVQLRNNVRRCFLITSVCFWQLKNSSVFRVLCRAKKYERPKFVQT